MTIALWCVLIAGLMPIVVAGLSKARGNYDNADPRRSMLMTEGMQRRLYDAHNNCFEAFPLFAAGVIMAEIYETPGATIDALAVAFVVLRILYIAAYATDRANARSLLWTGALVCTIAIFTSPAWS
jgi:uncharacterized MAPEG superfamily protein